MHRLRREEVVAQIDRDVLVPVHRLGEPQPRGLGAVQLGGQGDQLAADLVNGFHLAMFGD